MTARKQTHEVRCPIGPLALEKLEIRLVRLGGQVAWRREQIEVALHRRLYGQGSIRVAPVRKAVDDETLEAAGASARTVHKQVPPSQSASREAPLSGRSCAAN